MQTILGVIVSGDFKYFVVQMVQNFRKPLVVAAPKIMLRLPVSRVDSVV